MMLIVIYCFFVISFAAYTIPADGSVRRQILRGNDMIYPAKAPVAVSCPIVTGNFMVEMGGAKSTITISATPGGYGLVRIYQEPGAAPVKKTYSKLQFKNCRITSPKELDGYLTKDGFILRELSPDTDLIPKAMLLFYESVK